MSPATVVKTVSLVAASSPLLAYSCSLRIHYDSENGIQDDFPGETGRGMNCLDSVSGVLEVDGLSGGVIGLDSDDFARTPPVRTRQLPLMSEPAVRCSGPLGEIQLCHG